MDGYGSDLDMHPLTYISWLFPTKEPWGSDNATAMSTSSTQILAFKYYFPIKGTRAL